MGTTLAPSALKHNAELKDESHAVNGKGSSAKKWQR
jgi:hypothetical protein